MGYELRDISNSSDLQQPFKKLNVYRKAYDASLALYKVSASFPETERYGITNQIRRAATGICANIAEGYGRQISSDIDFKRFLIMAKRSCQEMSVWIDYCLDLGFIDSECHHKMQTEYTEISKMLFALIKSLQSRNT